MVDMSQYGNQAAINRQRALAEARYMVDMSQYGNQAAINRQRALAEALMGGAMGGQSGMPQQGGRIASAAGLGAVIGPMAQALMSSRLSKRADAGESAMKDAYTKAMDDYANKGFAAMQGTPEQRIPGELRFNPTSEPIPEITSGDQNYASELSKMLNPSIKPEQVIPGRAPDMAQAAQYFAKNPNTAAIAQKLMEKQAETIAQQNAPYDPSKFIGSMPGQSMAAAIPAGGLTNATVGQFLQRGFASGGMPKIEGDRAIDQGTGQMTNLPMTANQQATANYNQGMLDYNSANLQRQWAELKQRQQQFVIEVGLRRLGLSNEQARIALDRAKADPAYQAKLAATIKQAEAATQRGIDEGQKASDSLSGIDTLNDMLDMVPKTSDSAIGRGGRFVGAMFGWGGGTRAADKQLETMASQVALFAQRFPGVQTDMDYERMMAQVGAAIGWNTTQEEKQAALSEARNYMVKLVQKYGTPEDRAQLVKLMGSPAGGAAVPDDINDLVNRYGGQ